MARRTFRYDPKSDKMVEIVPYDYDPPVSVHGEITPFISPRDGTVIESRAQLRDYMARNDLVHYDDAKTQQPEKDRYAEQRASRELRERLWEGVSKTFSMGSKPRR